MEDVKIKIMGGEVRGNVTVMRQGHRLRGAPQNFPGRVVGVLGAAFDSAQYGLAGGSGQLTRQRKLLILERDEGGHKEAFKRQFQLCSACR